MYNALIESRVNLASPLERSRNTDEFQLSPSYTNARCSRDFCHTAGFKSRQTACLRIPHVFPPASLLNHPVIPRGDFACRKRSVEKCRLFRVVNSVIAGLLAMLILSYIYRMHSACFSSDYLDIVKYYRLRTFINGVPLHGVNHSYMKQAFISFDILFSRYYYKILFNSDFTHARYRFKYINVVYFSIVACNTLTVDYFEIDMGSK